MCDWPEELVNSQTCPIENSQCEYLWNMEPLEHARETLTASKISKYKEKMEYYTI